MEGAENSIEGNEAVAVVHFEMLVMQVVDVVLRVEPCPVRQPNSIEAVVSHRRCESAVLQVENYVNWVRRNDPVKQHAREIQEVFDGVHREA